MFRIEESSADFYNFWDILIIRYMVAKFVQVQKYVVATLSKFLKI
jgi:hypothetical protein